MMEQSMNGVVTSGGPVRQAEAAAVAFFERGCPPLRYPRLYMALILISLMDIIMTSIVLAGGGYEANWLARVVIDTWGMAGAVAWKYALILFVIIACEVVGRADLTRGRKLVWFANLVSIVPVAWGMILTTQL